MISWYQFTLEQFKQVLWIQQNSQKNNPNELARSKKGTFDLKTVCIASEHPLSGMKAYFIFFFWKT